MDFSSFHAWWTVALFLLFLAIVRWAWSARRKKDFEEAANLALEDDRCEGQRDV